jgi:hypothetical protein
MRFADQARRAALELSKGGRQPISRQDLGDRLGIQSRPEMRRVDTAIKALVKAGDLEAQGGGLYRWTGQALKPSKQEVMWRYLRARRAVTAEELQEVAEATPGYVMEWLKLLVTQKLVRREGDPSKRPQPGDKYRLVQDPGPEPPRNESKAQYLKRRREQQKQALAKLDTAFAAVAEARLAVSQMKEE